jgi:hypothetical protein
VISGFFRHKVSEVFTPRRTEVNRDLYIDRPALETALIRALEGTKHVVVHGESGSGKSWLFKKVLDDLKSHYVIASAANAVRYGSLTLAVSRAVDPSHQLRLVGMEQTKDAALKIPIAEAGVAAKRQYAIDPGDPLAQSFAQLRKDAGSRLAVLVLDNLEFIVSNDELMQELASIITVLDDEAFREFNVKILIVGVPSIVRDYFHKTPARQSVTNRLTEVPEVSSLSRQQVDALVEKGFLDLLRVDVPTEVLATWKSHINEVTLGYAQAVQEYCEKLAYIVEDNGYKGDVEQLQQADADWLTDGMNSAQVSVAERLNERNTRVGRRNQVLYVLGRLPFGRFGVPEIEAIVRDEFKDSSEGKTLAIGQILQDLASGPSAIIKQAAGGGGYEFRDARTAMALRVMLRREEDRDKVVRVL